MAKKNDEKLQSQDKLRLETGLTQRQENAAALLAVGTTIAETARQVGVERNTVYRWLRQPAFCAHYKQQLKDVRREIRGRLSAMAEEAAGTLEILMRDGGEQSRLKAATYVLDRLSEDEKIIKKAKAKKNEKAEK